MWSCQPYGVRILPMELQLDMCPETFDGRQIRRICRQIHDCKSVFFTRDLRYSRVLVATCGVALSCWNSRLVTLSSASTLRNGLNSVHNTFMYISWVTVPGKYTIGPSLLPTKQPQIKCETFLLFVFICMFRGAYFSFLFWRRKTQLLEGAAVLWLTFIRSNNVFLIIYCSILMCVCSLLKQDALLHAFASKIDELQLSICGYPILVVNILLSVRSH